jgi:hypothetical protein
VPEILDAEQLSILEQQSWDKRKIGLEAWGDVQEFPVSSSLSFWRTIKSAWNMSNTGGRELRLSGITIRFRMQ